MNGPDDPIDASLIFTSPAEKLEPLYDQANPEDWCTKSVTGEWRFVVPKGLNEGSQASRGRGMPGYLHLVPSG